jgi:coenzyme F420-0:L-glutamate ligase / coenzyme F420-1:gamma-L-glutamate ligase
MINFPRLELIGLKEFNYVQPGDNIASLIVEYCQKKTLTIQNEDIFVVTQKIVSKSENRYRNLQNIKPGLRAQEYAFITKKDPRFVQLVLDESNKVLRAKKNTLIVEHKNGFICANAGIDHSNTESHSNNPEDTYLLLPENSDLSAQRIRQDLENFYNLKLGVLIVDSHGRAWRNGTVGMTIGLSGIPGLVDLRGSEDLYGFKLKITMVAASDELAAAASLLMGQAKEGIPIVIARGFPYKMKEGSLSELIRDKKDDLFR